MYTFARDTHNQARRATSSGSRRLKNIMTARESTRFKLVDRVDIGGGVRGEALGARLSHEHRELLLCDNLASLLCLDSIWDQQTALDTLLLWSVVAVKHTAGRP
jgi:hypothetical protein